MSTFQLFARHGEHHYDNIKYGYLVLFLSMVHILILVSTRFFYEKGWARSGRSSTRLRLVSVPLMLHIGVWFALLVGMLFIKVEFNIDDVSTFIKRFGRIAYALIPLDIFLVLRPNFVPHLHYVNLLPLHKWISRIILLFAVAHGIGFFIKWGIQGQLMKVFTALNFLGLVVFVASIVTLIISLRFFRRRIYKWFYLIHNITAWGLVFLIGFHARPGVTFFEVICAGLLVYQLYSRFWAHRVISRNIEVVSNEDSNLSIIKIPRGTLLNWTPSAHIRLNFTNQTIKAYFFPTHPYTIASLPENNSINLIIKKTDFTIDSYESYSLTGPFQSLSPNFFTTAENVVIIAGGSGISYALPVYNALASKPGVILKFIWCVKEKADVHVLREMKFNGKVDIYVTGVKNDNKEMSSGDDYESNRLLDAQEFELDSLQSDDSFLDDEDDENANGSKKDKFNYFTGRPNFNGYLQNLNQSVDKANKWVIGSGPKSLVDAAERWAKENKVRFGSEAYEM